MQVDYTTEEGLKYRVEVPAEFKDEPELGIIIGPPPLDSLNWPLKYEVKLNNQLFDRQLFTWSDVRRRPDEIRASLRAVFRTNEIAIMNLYKEDK